MNTLKTYLIYILLIGVVLLFMMFKIKGCVGPKPAQPTVISSQVTPTQATAKDNIGLPAGEKAKTVIDLGKHDSDIPGKVVDVKLVGTTDNKQFKVETTKSKLGFSFETKACIGFNGYLVPAVLQEVFVYDRYSLNIVAGYPSLGLGIEGLLTKNFGLVGGCTWNYLEYVHASDFSTYSPGLFQSRPFIGVAFGF